MIPRYAHLSIESLFSDSTKVMRWGDTELAVIAAREGLGLTPKGVHLAVQQALDTQPCNLEWWFARERETNHDLAAWIDERLRAIPVHLHPQWHKDMTSYDTEDAAFARALLEASQTVLGCTNELIDTLESQARQYRHTVMLERTHGQWAKLRSFGGRILTWLAPVTVARDQLMNAMKLCQYSRISGAIGNYGGGMTPAIEKAALDVLGLRPFYGATQILQRSIQAPLAQALQLIAETLGQIAIDFRLGARSGYTLWQEPFGKKQKGSSAMPHKKNTIRTEQVGGLLNLARGYVLSILNSIQTWEGRAIEQSCVERVAWPDLFHTILRMISVMDGVLGKMAVYRDHMLREILDSKGTYATDEAKNFLAEQCAARGIPFETAYRIVQLAAFNVFEPEDAWLTVRNKQPDGFEATDALIASQPPQARSAQTIQSVIALAQLRPNRELDATPEDVSAWNKLLSGIFVDGVARQAWDSLFMPSRLLKNEAHIFAELGIN